MEDFEEFIANSLSAYLVDLFGVEADGLPSFGLDGKVEGGR